MLQKREAGIMDLPYICPISPLRLRCISLYLPMQEREADIMDLLYALDGHGRRTHDVRYLPCISPVSPLYLPCNPWTSTGGERTT